MNKRLENLVAMRDSGTLYELMTEDEDWLTQFDAAEALIKLGDQRGYEFVVTAMLSDDEEILEVAREIHDSPEFAQLQRSVEAEQEGEKRARLEAARKRLQTGGKVYRYKMIYLAAGALMGDDPLGKGFEVPALDQYGLEGWEVVNMLPTRRALLVGSVDDHFTGAYFLLKKEISPNESAELNKE